MQGVLFRALFCNKTAPVEDFQNLKIGEVMGLMGFLTAGFSDRQQSLHNNVGKIIEWHPKLGQPGECRYNIEAAVVESAHSHSSVGQCIHEPGHRSSALRRKNESSR